LFGTGTISAPGDGGLGSLLEISAGGRRPVELASGETRRFLEEGDTVIMRARCRREGFATIGLGGGRGTIAPGLWRPWRPWRLDAPENAAAVGFKRWNVASASSKRNILLLRVLRGLEFPPDVRSFSRTRSVRPGRSGDCPGFELSTPGRPY